MAGTFGYGSGGDLWTCLEGPVRLNPVQGGEHGNSEASRVGVSYRRSAIAESNWGRRARENAHRPRRVAYRSEEDPDAVWRPGHGRRDGRARLRAKHR